MEVEDEMFEEHLDEENSSGTTTPASSEDPAMPEDSLNAAEKRMKTRRELFCMVAHHLQDYRRSIMLIRRRGQRRRQRRLAIMRTFFLQQLVDFETKFLQMLPMDESTQFDESENFTRFYEDLMPALTEKDWPHYFRMQKHSFGWLCKHLERLLQPVGFNAPNNKIIPVGKRVAIGLYALSSGADYGDIARLCDVSRASVCKFVKRFAEALLKKWGHSLLAMPRSEEEWEEIGVSFNESVTITPAAIGVLGVCEISVNPQTDKQQSYINEAGSAKIIMELLIDDKLLIRKVQVGNKMPSLFLKDNNDIAQLPLRAINGQNINRFVVAPAAYYPLRPWLMHQYENPKEPHHYDFNDAVHNIFHFKDQAMWRLFARWRILQCKSDLEPHTMETIALTCCALHNLLEENDEIFKSEWLENVEMDRFHISSPLNPLGNSKSDASQASEARDFLAHTISSTEYNTIE